MKNQIDINDHKYVQERYGKVVASMPSPLDRFGQINPHVSCFVIAGKTDIVSVFHVKPIYYEHRSSSETELIFRPLYEVCEYYGNHRITIKYEKLDEIHPNFLAWLIRRQELIGGVVEITSPYKNEKALQLSDRLDLIGAAQISFTVTTVYPDPNVETTTVDGFVTSGYKTTMQLMHDTVTGDGASDLSPYSPKYTLLRTLRNGSGYYGGRTMFLFNTASIDDGDTISSANLSVFGITTNYVNNSSTSYEIVQTNPASNTQMVAGDFGAYSFTSFASIAFASLSQSAYNDFALNASGLANITKTGVSKFGGVTGQDLNVAAQTSGHDNIFCAYEADHTGTSEDPKLAVTHSASVVGTYRGMFALLEKA